MIDSPHRAQSRPWSGDWNSWFDMVSGLVFMVCFGDVIDYVDKIASGWVLARES